MSIIYLILSAELDEDGEIVQKILKIGYTEEKEKRFKAYELHNPGCRILYTIEGTREDETSLHEYFKDLQWRGEWFKYDERIVNYFKDRKLNIDQIPTPTINNNRIYWKDLEEVNLWLSCKYGVNETYLKVLFDFKDPTLFNPDPYIDSENYYLNLSLLESIFKRFNNNTAKKLDCLRDIKYQIQSLISKGSTLDNAVSEMNKTLLNGDLNTNT
jgi:hypothetical protein